MSSRSEHLATGAAIGAIVAVITARPQNFSQALAASLTGAVSGAAGAAAPDVLEPATSSYHRKTCHSVACAGLVAYGTTRGAKTSMRAPTFGERLMRANAVAAGAGYLSHLGLDARTPRGLPII